MKSAKKLAVWFLSLTLCLVCFVVPVCAETLTQDGIEVTLTTDKDSYAQGEKIAVTVTATNTNDTAVSNVSIENLIPDGFQLADGTSATANAVTLEAGETLELNCVYEAAASGGDTSSGASSSDDTSSEPNTDNSSDASTGTSSINSDNGTSNTSTGVAKTGDNSNMVWLAIVVLASAAVLVVLCIKKKKQKNALSLMLCVAMVGTMGTGLSKDVFAKTTLKTLTLTHTVQVNGQELILKTNVNYECEETDTPTEFPDLNLGEDVEPDLDFEPEEADPTFDSAEEEIINLMELNGDEFPYIDSDDNGVPNFIDGVFSEKTVSSAEEAVNALNDIHHIMQFENANQEFIEVYSENLNLDGQTNYYRLQQVYHNIPVYGHQLIVSTNSDGKIVSLSGHYLPELEINTQPLLTVENAKSLIVDKVGNAEMRSDGLFIYTLNSNRPTLVWKITTVEYVYYVNASSGVIVDMESNLLGTDIGTGIDMSGEEINFPIYHSDNNNSYYMCDVSKKIYQLNSNHSSTAGSLVSVKNNTSQSWSQYPEAISAYSNISKTFDFYSNILGHSGANRALKPIYITVNYREKNSEAYANAYFTPAYSDKTVLRIGDYTNYAQALDVIAHEFTHAVNDAIWDPVYFNEAGALDEAYADILGELIENRKLEYIGEDLTSGTLRSFIKPSDYGDSDNFSNHKEFCSKSGHHDCECGDSADHVCDNGNVHSNSGIINHAAYLMDQNWPESNHSEELATLFYKSMYYMASSTPNQDFMDCRHAVLAAAKSMNMNDEKRAVIANSFESVGIAYEDSEAWMSAHHIIGVVKDAETNANVIDAQVIAVRTDKELGGGGIGYTNGTGNYDVKVNRGIYRVTVAADGYRLYTIENVDVSSWTNMNNYMETIYLVPAEWGDNTQNVFASGKITNALTGDALDGVTVKFRNGAGNQSGSYVQTVAGLDIELTTDSSGQYYTAALPAGNYTLEASKDGFITGYANIVAGNSDVCSNQNIALTPELSGGTTRIVLTWAANPRDLDSHVVGTLTDGTVFHTYFGNKSDYDGDIEVCNLDVDDTTGYGPETITLNPTNSAPYYYYIHRWAGSGTVASSEANIKVYQGSTLIAQFNVPTDQGEEDYWNVFAIVNGNLIIRNTITSNAELNYADTVSDVRSANIQAVLPQIIAQTEEAKIQ